MRHWVLLRNVNLLDVFIKLTLSLGTHSLAFLALQDSQKIVGQSITRREVLLGFQLPRGIQGGGNMGQFGPQGESEAIFGSQLRLTPLTTPSLVHLYLELIYNN